MTTDDVFDLEHGSHVSGSTTAVIVRWVRGQLGDDGVNIGISFGHRGTAAPRHRQSADAGEDRGSS